MLQGAVLAWGSRVLQDTCWAAGPAAAVVENQTVRLQAAAGLLAAGMPVAKRRTAAVALGAAGAPAQQLAALLVALLPQQLLVILIEGQSELMDPC